VINADLQFDEDFCNTHCGDNPVTTPCLIQRVTDCISTPPRAVTVISPRPGPQVRRRWGELNTH